MEIRYLELVQQPLDEKEAEHVLASAIKAADRAVMSKEFEKIKKENDFYSTVFEHDDEQIRRKNA